ncbi:MAG: type IV pilus assembly protein PilM [Armatimonadetes bacterium]|nr:type IV pilus assembly protein PilM [Armatimonadota bacterium]
MAFRPTVGLDIGSQQIKAVELRPGKGGRLTVSAVGVAPTPAGVMQNNIITDPQLMGQAVKQLLRECGIREKRTVGSVAGQSAVVVRIIEVPKMTDAELKETMRWEVERHVPFAPSETVIDYQPLVSADPMADSNPNMEVLLAVAQQDVISNYVDTLFAAGLDPLAIDIEPLAVSRATLDLVDGRPVTRPTAPPPPPPSPDGGEFAGMPMDTGPHDTAAIVNIGATNTDISIYQDGQLMFPRSLPLAGDSLTRAIADSLGLPPEQAERLKRDHASVQLDRMAVYTGTYYGDEPNFESPQFGDDLSFGGAPSSRLRPFGEGEANPFEMNPEGPQFDDLDRTQPMSSRTLDLAKPPPPAEKLPFTPTDDTGFTTPDAGPAVDDEQRNQIFEAIAPVLGELATELRRSLDYYRSRAQGRSVDRVLLTGGSASLGNLASFLQRELQVPVLVADPLAGLDVAAKHYDAQYLQVIAPVFAIALGLAARDAVFDANPAPRPAKAPRAPKGAKAAAPGEPTVPPVS